MSIDADKRRLSQVQTLQNMQRSLKWNEMLTVYQAYTEEYSKHYIYGALIPSVHIEEALSVSTWDMEFSQCMPSGMISNKRGKEVREYLRYGVDNGVEPLIIDRSFHRLRDGYREISEEFRLFHDLYHDKKTDQYTKINEDGNEEVVAVVEPHYVQIRLKDIRQFLAIKEMYLAIQFIFSETSTQTLEELGFTAGDEDRQDDLMRWMQRYGDLDGINNCRAFSRLVGKRVVEPLPKAKVVSGPLLRYLIRNIPRLLSMSVRMEMKLSTHPIRMNSKHQRILGIFVVSIKKLELSHANSLP